MNSTSAEAGPSYDHLTVEEYISDILRYHTHTIIFSTCIHAPFFFSIIDVFAINPLVFRWKTFLSTQFFSKKSHEQDVAIFTIHALIIVVMNLKNSSHLMWCMRSFIVLTVHSLFMTQDVPSGRVSCKGSFRMCSLDLLTLLRDICKALLGVIRNLFLSSKGLLLFPLYVHAGESIDSHYPPCCVRAFHKLSITW